MTSLLQELAAAQERIQALEGVLEGLLGPDPDIPPYADVRSLDVARPPLRAAFWRKGPWRCLRIEERTAGYRRPTPFISKDKKTGKSRMIVRQDNEVERWMRWGTKILEAFEVEPIPVTIPVRVIFIPGLVWTFMAWREVERAGRLHPMDPDNACKPSLDFAQSQPVSAEKARPYGAYVNDTQVVDLLVYRIPQEGEPEFDRVAITKARSEEKKAREQEKKARERMAELEAGERTAGGHEVLGGGPPA